MNSSIITYVWRLILVILLQVLVFRQLSFGWSGFNYFNVLIYPVAVMTLPIKIPKNALLLVSFIAGLIIDIFYDSLGVHASALVFLSFIRPYILNTLEPRGGYNVNISPTKFYLGMKWILRYTAVMLFPFLFFYFSMEVFTLVYIKEIILKTVFSFIISYVFILLYLILFNPK